MWRTLSGRPIPNIVREVRRLLGDDDKVIHVGTDSKQRGSHTDFVTVIAIVDPGRGGLVFWQRDRAPRCRALAQKLFRETELSLDIANVLDASVPQSIIVHVDANVDLRHRSSKYVRALAGMVVGFGFKVMVKPHSWCASHVADFVVNGKHVRVA